MIKSIFTKSKFLTICICLLFLLLTLAYLPFALSPFQKPNIRVYPSTFSLNFSPLNHFRQSLNNCGSYSVSGVLNIFDKEMVDPEKIASDIGFKIKDRLTFPIGLESYLKDKNMDVDSANVIGLNDKDKIDFLKSEISQGKAGIIIVKLPNSSWYYLHYITVLGYDNNNFYVYDSLVPRSDDSKYTLDLNGEFPGNKSIDSGDLVKMWNEGNIMHYPKNYNLFVKPKLQSNNNTGQILEK